MADPAQINIIADRRVAYIEQFAFLGDDWTGSTFKMQVRLVRDSTGTPLEDWSTSSGTLLLDYAATDTVANHVAAGRLAGAGDDSIYRLENPGTGVPYVAGDSLALSLLHIGIAASAIAAMPFPAELGDDAVFYYDVIRTPSVGDADLVMRGTFTVRAGVTIP